MKTFLLFIIGFFFIAFSTLAQDNRPDRLGIGIGPSILYGDNTGKLRKLKYKVLPVISLDYNKKIETFFDVKATFGYQIVNSGDFLFPSQITKIAAADLPHAFSGHILYGDVMPIYHFNPDQSGYLPALIKVYTGLGIGYFQSNRTDEKLILNDTGNRTETYPASDSGIYFPVRVGIYKNLPSDAEIGVEGSLIISPFSEMEGNDQQKKMFKSDMLVQLQFYYRIYIGK
ncbi:MAG: hypothetical protein R6V72_17895 [Cyclobacterium sp.]|uniref:hypothetical protein n=1 Tax=unclassified Cyclobacterium TaxID=2615055 RepID=UPI0013D311E8|nr:hypothetical protein [Cyclobacterium sp. SYSU L10401]